MAADSPTQINNRVQRIFLRMCVLLGKISWERRHPCLLASVSRSLPEARRQGCLRSQEIRIGSGCRNATWRLLREKTPNTGNGFGFVSGAPRVGREDDLQLWRKGNRDEHAISHISMKYGLWHIAYGIWS